MTTIPAINIREEKSNYKIEMSVPGFKKKDFNIYTEGKELIISCKKEFKRRSEHDVTAFSRKPSNDSYFSRFLSLPDNADSDRVTAKYNGILKLNIPKKRLENQF